MFTKLFDKVKGRKPEAEEIIEEYEPPVLYPQKIEMTPELLLRQREEMLRKRYGAVEDKSGYIL